MAITFLRHTPSRKYVVDHKDNNPLNDRLSNLQIITNRLNNSKDKKNKTSKFTGVSWNISTGKWRAMIYLDGKLKSLGRFIKEKDAAKAYNKALTNSLL